MRLNKVLLTAATVLFFLSCNNGNQTEEKKAADSVSTAAVTEPAFTPFKIDMVQLTVKDFAKWKEVFLSRDSIRQAYGISQYGLARGLEDSNKVYVINKMEDAKRAKEFAALPGTKEAMKKGGVTGTPTFIYADVIRNDDSKIDQRERAFVSHHVKDFDTWLKAYDQEGKATRAANGLVDRGMARGIDDPNQVYIVFAITDMVKAKARMASEDLKKIMMNAGVEGPPTIQFYRLVD